ncbi:MAG: hypothetical protein AAGE80_01835 [Pseudomonadota bacterium]
MINRRSRMLFVDAGTGLLAGFAAHSGARRVIALDADQCDAQIMAALFAENRLGAEAIFGALARDRPLEDQSTVEANASPWFDRDLILAEERIDTMILSVGTTDPTLISQLPSSVSAILLTNSAAGAPPAERDRLIVHTISEGFSYDPAASRFSALLFRRYA